MDPRSQETERKLLHRLNRCGRVPTLLALSNLYHRSGSHKRLALLERAVGVDPFCHDARVWFHYGQALEASAPYWLSKEPTSAAIDAYRTAAELDPHCAEAWSALARCHYLPQQSVFDTVEQALRNAIRANPTVGHYWYRLGKLLAYGPSRPQEAAALYERGLSLCDRDAQFGWQWYELARIYHDKLGRNDDAERAVLVALELQPDFRAYAELLAAIRGAKETPESSSEA